MTKYLVSLSVTLVSGDAVTFADTATYGGGSSAWAQVQSGMAIKVADESGKMILIPYHAVAKAEATLSTQTIDDPEDTFCVAESDDSGEDEGGEG